MTQASRARSQQKLRRGLLAGSLLFVAALASAGAAWFARYGGSPLQHLRPTVALASSVEPRRAAPPPPLPAPEIERAPELPRKLVRLQLPRLEPAKQALVKSTSRAHTKSTSRAAKAKRRTRAQPVASSLSQNPYDAPELMADATTPGAE